MNKPKSEPQDSSPPAAKSPATSPGNNLAGALTHAAHALAPFRLSTLTLTLPLSLAAMLLTTGCSMLSYTGPTGEHFARFSLGTKTAIAALNVESGTNGIRRLELQGYTNDSNQALSTVTEAAVRAALGAAR